LATWLAHLRIAEKVFAEIDGLDQSLFYVGNIAPDSGLPDENWETFDPPTEVTHFKAPDTSFYYAQDLEFYRQYLQNGVSLETDHARFSFLLGYFFHLIVDNLWDNHFDKPLRKKYKKEFAADPKFIWETKLDTYGVDHVFLRDQPKSEFWQLFVNAHYDKEYLSHLSAKAINHRIAYIKDYYQTETDEVRAMFKCPFIYLDQQGMISLIDQFTQTLLQIYQLIWQKKQPLTGKDSMLEMFSN